MLERLHDIYDEIHLWAVAWWNDWDEDEIESYRTFLAEERFEDWATENPGGAIDEADCEDIPDFDEEGDE